MRQTLRTVTKISRCPRSFYIVNSDTSYTLDTAVSSRVTCHALGMFPLLASASVWSSKAKLGTFVTCFAAGAVRFPSA